MKYKNIYNTLILRIAKLQLGVIIELGALLQPKSTGEITQRQYFKVSKSPREVHIPVLEVNFEVPVDCSRMPIIRQLV